MCVSAQPSILCTTVRKCTGNREIQSLVIRCENYKHGCHWEGQLSALKQHLRTKCPYALVHCPRNCKTMIFRGRQPQHMRDECPLRQYKCPYCRETGIYQNRTTTHLEVCPRVPVKCPNVRCDSTVPAIELKQHIDTDCEYSFINCKFEPLGCAIALLRKEIKQHEEDNQYHFDVIIQAYAGLKKKLEQTEMEKHDLAVKVQRLDSKISRPLAALEGRRKNATTTITVKIKQFSLYNHCKVASNSIIYSSEGHKLRVQITPNNLNHVSITFTVMRSDEDDNLPWPYGGKIQLEVLNQMANNFHYERQVNYPKVYGSRITGRSMSMISYGALEFISHKDLENGIYRGGPDEEIGNRPHVQYLVEDTVYFRVSTRPYWLQCTN